MDLLRALRVFDALATLLGLNCHFSKGRKHLVNVVYCILGLTLKIVVSAMCLCGVLHHLILSSRHDDLNVTNLLLLASYKATSILLFLGIIYFHLRKHAAYVNIFSSLTNEAVELGCFGEIYAFLQKYATCVGVIGTGAIWGLFLVQVTQFGFGYKIDLAHSAVTSYATMYFEMKFTLVAKSAQFLFEKINSKIVSVKESPKMVLDVYPRLRKVHNNVYTIISEANQVFGPLLMLTEILQFQVLIYSGYVFVVDLWDLEDKFTKNKMKIMLVSSLYWVLIFCNYLHMTSTCSKALQKGQETACKLLAVESETTHGLVRDEATLFCEQLLHYGKRSFNILGLCTINNSYIFIVFGALATYLATLVQFHLLALQFQQEK